MKGIGRVLRKAEVAINFILFWRWNSQTDILTFVTHMVIKRPDVVCFIYRVGWSNTTKYDHQVGIRISILSDTKQGSDAFDFTLLPAEEG